MASSALTPSSGVLHRDAERRRGVMDKFPGGFSRLLDGRSGFAGGRHGSVKKLFVFLVRTRLGLRRARPGLRGPARSTIHQDAERPRVVMGELPG